MSAPDSLNPETPVHLPSCGRLLEVLVVNPAGELIGCEECADEFGWRVVRCPLRTGTPPTR